MSNIEENLCENEMIEDDVIENVEQEDGYIPFEYKDLMWCDEEHTILKFMLHHPEYGWIPYSTSETDTGIGKKLWDLRDALEITEFERPIKSLEDVKKEKLNTLNLKASQFEKTENKEMVVTSSLGFRINADPKAKRNIDTLIELGVTTFRDYDNEIHANVSLEDLTTIKREISLNAVNLYNQKWQMEYQINTLETIEEVEKYQIHFEMLNFSL